MDDTFWDILIWLAGFLAASAALLIVARLLDRRTKRKREERFRRFESILSGFEIARVATDCAEGRVQGPVPAIPGTSKLRTIRTDTASCRRPLHIMRTAVSAGIVIGGMLCFLLGDGKAWSSLIFAAVLAAIGFSVSTVWLRLRTAKSLPPMDRAMPDALELCRLWIQGGLSVSQALEMTAKQLHPLHSELADVFVKSATSEGEDRALIGYVRAAHPQAADRLARAFEAEKSRLAEEFAALATELRGEWRHQVIAELQAVTNHIKYPVAYCLAPALYLLLLAPAMTSLLGYFEGHRQTRSIPMRSSETESRPLSAVGTQAAPDGK